MVAAAALVLGNQEQLLPLAAVALVEAEEQILKAAKMAQPIPDVVVEVQVMPPTIRRLEMVPMVWFLYLS
jgi:hypothetical protein